MKTEATRHVEELDVHDHDCGLSFDLTALMSRRRALQLLAVGGLATIVGCGSSDDTTTATDAATATATTGTTGTTTASGSTGDATVAEVPEETAGPFPADGSNGPNVLTESGVVRQDITSSFGSSSGVAAGVPLTIALTILDVAKGGTPVDGAAVYLWHCDQAGNYSIYSPSVSGENYLRGVQAAAADGTLTFSTIFPGCYAGRWPHVHFEVYPSLDAATAAGSKLVTSQIALPEETCTLVYATEGYEQSVGNLAGLSLETDLVFHDGFSTQLGTARGSVDDGLTISLNVGV